MGNSSASKEEQKTLDNLSDKSQFSREELCKLLEKFKKKYSTGYMTKEEFIQENISLQGGNQDFWAEVFDGFTKGNEKNDRITFADFIIGLTSITSGTEEEKLEWMFNMYDVDGNKTLDKEEVHSLVRGLIKANNEQDKSNEEIAKMANQFFDEMDSDKNGSIDLKEFIQVSLKTPFIKDSLTCVMTQSLEVEKNENEFSTFENQVAGHKGKSAMLKDPSGKTIFKPLHPTEFEFYQTLKNYPETHKFFPKFHGRKVVQEEGSQEVSTYVQMQNLTDGLIQPCICDLKMGFKGYDHTAGKLKIAQQVALCTVTTSSSLGFRMCGMRYFNGSDLIVRDKPWGAKLSKTTMQDAIFQFLTRCRFDVALIFCEKLKELLQWFNEQKLFKFFSSSILLIYDAASYEKETIDIKVVDFAHTFPSNDGKIDENYRDGLINLVNIMEKISALSNQIYENQKKKGEQWSRSFLGSERAEYTNEDGSIPIVFRESNLWKVDRELPNSDEDGWQYASSYKGSWHSVMTKKDTVRRRRWTKK